MKGYFSESLRLALRFSTQGRYHTSFPFLLGFSDNLFTADLEDIPASASCLALAMPLAAAP
jgi:hypothetical protein